MSISFSGTDVNWFADGVGPVKSKESVKFTVDGESGRDSFTMELIAYHVPEPSTELMRLAALATLVLLARGRWS